MNKRVKELAEQTGFRHDNGEWQFGGDSEVEKFAELIVKEMCQVMKDEGEQFLLDQNFDAVRGVGCCMRKVKEHFGVE